MIKSSAQNREDVMLARAFDHKTDGFYIDVGAMDPDEMSITRYFYDLGWRGINVEPDPRFFSRLVEARPGDVNLPIALSSQEGRRNLYVSQTKGLTSLYSERIRDFGEIQPHLVNTSTLAAVCERHAKQDIDFLKVDVEGAETEVLRGSDWQRFRPKIVLVESTAVNSYESTWHEWDPILTQASYKLVYEDGINRFYCRMESLELEGAFGLPPNVLDNYVTADLIREQVRRNALEKEVADLRDRLARLDAGETNPGDADIGAS
ncbi:MAG: FkbM family methyltransferase [Acidobacteria bacterium]|nr:FkbM family methyltransferase [Acidobacteriota bacterium]